MQSILQYRKVKGQIRAQLDKHGAPGDGIKTTDNVAAFNEDVRLPGRGQDLEVEGPAHVQSSAAASSRVSLDGAAGARETPRRYSLDLTPLMTGIDLRKRTTREGGGDGEILVVGFRDADDELNPLNWSMGLRSLAMFHVALICWVVGFASSTDSSVVQKAADQYGVPTIVESLATAIYLIAFGLGSLISGPFSEEFGRNPVYVFNLVVFMTFVMASALAPNLAAQLVFRFGAGFFGSTPLTCAGGTLADVFTPTQRVFVFPLFGVAAFTGPVFGRLTGGFIAESSLAWQWAEWLTLIITGFITISVTLFQPETYAPILLKYKAQLLREATGDARYVAGIEIRADSFGRRLVLALYRPFLLLVREPILVLFSVYLSVVYLIFFGFFDGWGLIFGTTYNLSQGLVGTTFLAVAVGVVLAACLTPLMYRGYCAAMREAGTRSVTKLPPELRLWWAMLGAPALPISMFWMGWTARPDVPVWSPLGASVLFGFGTLCVFISCYQYLIDCYEVFAASALASASFMRYVVAGAMVVAGVPMYGNLGVPWSLTIMGGLSAVLMPVPFLFYRYGKKIRGYSKFAVD